MDAEARRLLEAQRTPELDVRGGRWRHRNVVIPWRAEHRVWGDPDRRDELDAILARGEGARILSTCWGMSPLALPRPHGGVVLAPSSLGIAPPAEPRAQLGDGGLVRCGLGATFADVFDALERSGRALANQPGFSGLSVAGCIGSGGHGSGLCLGPLLDLVESITIGSPSGPGTDEIGRDHPDFALHAMHLGRLGPVHGVTLRTVEAFRVAESRAVLPLGAGGRDWRRALRVLVDDILHLQRSRPRRIHSVELWIAPYPIDGVLTVAVGIRERTRAALSPDDVQRPAALRERALVALGETLAEVLATSPLREAVRGVLRETVRAVATCPPVIMPSPLGLDFGAPNDARMGAVEAAVPAERGADAVIAAIDALNGLADGSVPRFVFAPMGVRFVGRGPEGSLSPHAGRAETVHIELPTFGDDDVYGGPHVLRPLQILLAEQFEGRPHWGQRIYLTAEQLRRLWAPEPIAAMARLVRARDPRGDFASPLLDAVLGLGP